MHYTDDPISDFNVWDAEQNKRLESLPVCECCGEPIQQEKAVYYNDQWICENCESDFWADIREDFLAMVND